MAHEDWSNLRVWSCRNDWLQHIDVAPCQTGQFLPGDSEAINCTAHKITLRRGRCFFFNNVWIELWKPFLRRDCLELVASELPRIPSLLEKVNWGVTMPRSRLRKTNKGTNKMSEKFFSRAHHRQTVAWKRHVICNKGERGTVYYRIVFYPAQLSFGFVFNVVDY